MALANAPTRCVVLHALILLVACREEQESKELPTMEEIGDLVERTCAIASACTDSDSGEDEAVDINQCEMESRLWTRLTAEGNAECSDVWLVYEFHDCEASLGCSDYLFTSPEHPGSPCHEELMAVYDANCAW